jgi:elongation factor 1-beta
MGKVAVSLRIMPESPDTDMEKVKSEIAKMAQLNDAKIEPLAFGLKALKILVVVPDSNFDGLEDKIKTISGVSEVEVESSTLI